jgi:hypothetical protein
MYVNVQQFEEPSSCKKYMSEGMRRRSSVGIGIDERHKTRNGT